MHKITLSDEELTDLIEALTFRASTPISEEDLEDIYTLIDCAEDLKVNAELNDDLFSEFSYVMSRIEKSELYADKIRKEEIGRTPIILTREDLHLLDRLTQMREFAKDTPSPLYVLRET